MWRLLKMDTEKNNTHIKKNNQAYKQHCWIIFLIEVNKKKILVLLSDVVTNNKKKTFAANALVACKGTLIKSRTELGPGALILLVNW